MTIPGPDEIRDLVRRVVESMVTEDQPPSDSGSAPAMISVDGTTSAAIAIGCDHGGYRLKELLAFRLKEAGREVVDVGSHSAESVDYPDFAHAVATLVGDGSVGAGVIIDGAGIGSAMVANKVPGVRAALCYDVSSAKNSREHNHANVLTLGASLIGDALAWQIVEAWLATEWGGGRHARRVGMITEIEQQYLR